MSQTPKFPTENNRSESAPALAVPASHALSLDALEAVVGGVAQVGPGVVNPVIVHPKAKPAGFIGGTDDGQSI